MKKRLFDVKICGITNSADAAFAVSAGASALGFVAFPGSPRYVRTETVREIRASVNPKVRFAGVFVNASEETIRTYIESGVNIVQLHGDETAKFAKSIATTFAGVPVWKCVKCASVRELEQYRGFICDAFLFDSACVGTRGGTGVLSDLNLALEAVKILDKPLILAGGLTPDNVYKAICKVKPSGVDVSSGVELKPGIKDPEKVAAFIREAKAAFADCVKQR